MTNVSSPTPSVTIGLDLGDKTTEAYVMSGDREWIASITVRTSPQAMDQAFAEYPGGRLVMEVGTHSPWVSRIFEARGFEVIVANPRRVQLIAKSISKRDSTDAELLCRLGHADPDLLAPIVHRSADAQRERGALRSRDALVRGRTALINSARGQVKAMGQRVPRCSAQVFPKRAREHVPEDLFPGLGNLLHAIDDLSAQVTDLDELIEQACRRHPATNLLQQVPGVGPVTALSYVLSIDDPTRFRRSRDVGPYLGLCPRRRQSGTADPQLPISKAGDESLRRLLVSAARYIMRTASPDTDLKRFGLRLAGGGSRAERNRAAVAVARKLAVLLHRLWVTGEVYVPLGYPDQTPPDPGRGGSLDRAALHRVPSPDEAPNPRQRDHMNSALTKLSPPVTRTALQ